MHKQLTTRTKVNKRWSNLATFDLVLKLIFCQRLTFNPSPPPPPPKKKKKKKNQRILDSIKLKESADDIFKFDENGSKLAKKVRKHCGKRRNCSKRAISPFHTAFSKDLFCRQVKTRACFGKFLNIPYCNKISSSE